MTDPDVYLIGFWEPTDPKYFFWTGAQKHYTKSFAKKMCRRAFTKNPKPIFSRFILLRPWAFLGEVKNTRGKGEFGSL
jgi:hypothetical protein